MDDIFALTEYCAV